MVNIRHRRSWEIAEALATPEEAFLNRRALLAAMGIGTLAAAGSPLRARAAEGDPTADLYPA